MHDLNPVVEQTSATTIITPTVKDLQLAEALGYERPSNIRNLIKRHATSLEAMGSLLHREAMIATAKGPIGTLGSIISTRLRLHSWLPSRVLARPTASPS